MTERQRLFVNAFIKHRDGKKAAIDAGYPSGTAAVTACRLLKDPNVKPEIDRGLTRLQDAALFKNQVTVDRVIAEYAKVAFLDPGQFYDADGSLKPLDQIPPEARAAITQLEQRSHAITRVKFASKQQALDALARYLGIFGADVSITNAPAFVINIDCGRTGPEDYD